MTERHAYSYREDASVPAFADDKPIIVFDGHCVLCSGWARVVIRWDVAGRYRLLAAQSPLGQALYRHYGLDARDFETNLLIADGRAFMKSDGSIRMFAGLGWPWRAVSVARLVPQGWRDKGYDAIAKNRFRLFGRADACLAPTPDIAGRFLA